MNVIDVMLQVKELQLLLELLEEDKDVSFSRRRLILKKIINQSVKVNRNLKKMKL